MNITYLNNTCIIDTELFFAIGFVLFMEIYSLTFLGILQFRHQIYKMHIFMQTAEKEDALAN